MAAVIVHKRKSGKLTNVVLSLSLSFVCVCASGMWYTSVYVLVCACLVYCDCTCTRGYSELPTEGTLQTRCLDEPDSRFHFYSVA